MGKGDGGFGNAKALQLSLEATRPSAAWDGRDEEVLGGSRPDRLDNDLVQRTKGRILRMFANTSIARICI
jgi:hypothetical protein